MDLVAEMGMTRLPEGRIICKIVRPHFFVLTAWAVTRKGISGYLEEDNAYDFK